MLYYVIEKSVELQEFEAWSGGLDRLNAIIELGKVEEAQGYIEELLHDIEEVVTDTTINDILWFEMDDLIEQWESENGVELQDVNPDTVDNFKTYEGYEGAYIVEDYIRHKDVDTVIDHGHDLEDLQEAYEGDDVYYYYIGLDGKAYAPQFG